VPSSWSFGQIRDGHSMKPDPMLLVEARAIEAREIALTLTAVTEEHRTLLPWSVKFT